MTKTQTRLSGQHAEDYARLYLEQQGLNLLTSNYRCKAGEIDLIMKERDHIVFIEVRLRNHQRYACGFETVDYRKQQKIIRTALHFLQKHKLLDASPCRFDIVSLKQNCVDSTAENTAQKNNHPFDIEWISDAFQIS